MEDMQKYDEDFFLFLEAGFIAINQADEDSCVKLFKTCELLRPNNLLHKVGIGYLHLHKLEVKEAISHFQEVLDEEPDNDMAMTLLGVAKTLTPDQVAAGERLLTQSVQESNDPYVKNAANTALDFVDRFIKKYPGPAEVKPKPPS